MSPVLVKERQPSIAGDDISNVASGEVMALCPGCKAFQSLGIADGRLINTRKFRQDGNQIYHDCASAKPCHLYRIS